MIGSGLLLRANLQMPMYYKIIIANAMIIGLGAFGGTWLAKNFYQQSNFVELLSLFLTVGVSVSITVNFFLVMLAFRPLFVLQHTMESVKKGNLQSRVSEIADDPDVARLGETFNQMLDTIGCHQKNLSSQIIRAQEEERKRIARELHDETSQSLASLIMSFDIVLKSFPQEGNAEARERLEGSRTLVLRMLDDIRRLTFDLRPAMLDDFGLVPAIRHYLKTRVESTGIEVKLTMDGLEERLAGDLETNLYRIIQESLTNVIKHARARNVEVELTRRDNEITLEINDDGRGFDAGNFMEFPRQNKGFGLFGIKERADLVGGKFRIDSAPGRGTKVSIKIPLGEDGNGKNKGAVSG